MHEQMEVKYRTGKRIKGRAPRSQELASNLLFCTTAEPSVRLNLPPFSTRWMVVGIVLYTVLEMAIALVLAPAIFAGRMSSHMLQWRLQMVMHLGSFYLGGLALGIITPGIRLAEPAAAAFVSVGLVFLMSFFSPSIMMQWSFSKLIVGGGIAAVLAVMGAYTGEKWMGNVEGEAGIANRLQRLLAKRGSGGQRVTAKSLSSDTHDIEMKR